MIDRTEAMLELIDVASGKGLEIGPLAAPVISRDLGDLRYLDHVDPDRLRAVHQTHQRLDAGQIVPLDYVLDGRSIPEVVGSDAPFDYVVASHVIEHVPDPITWLRDIRSILRVGGVVSLAVPDKRRNFDILREPSQPADLVDAYIRRVTTPTPQQIFSHFSMAMAYEGETVWGFDPPIDDLQPVHTEHEAWLAASQAFDAHEYRDVHCWVFTPESFMGVAESLQRLELLPFSIERCTDTSVGEFFVTLRASGAAEAHSRTADADRIDRIDRKASSIALQRKLASTELELWHATRERDQYREQLELTHATLSWKLTQPLRAAGAMLRSIRAKGSGGLADGS